VTIGRKLRRVREPLPMIILQHQGELGVATADQILSNSSLSASIAVQVQQSPMLGSPARVPHPSL
jgi:hypothetical protein